MTMISGEYQITAAPRDLGGRVLAYSNFQAGVPTAFFFSYIENLVPGVTVELEFWRASDNTLIATQNSTGTATGYETIAFPLDATTTFQNGFTYFVRVSKTGGTDVDGVSITNAFVFVNF